MCVLLLREANYSFADRRLLHCNHIFPVDGYWQVDVFFMVGLPGSAVPFCVSASQIKKTFFFDVNCSGDERLSGATSASS